MSKEGEVKRKCEKRKRESYHTDELFTSHLPYQNLVILQMFRVHVLSPTRFHSYSFVSMFSVTLDHDSCVNFYQAGLFLLIPG